MDNQETSQIFSIPVNDAVWQCSIMEKHEGEWYLCVYETRDKGDTWNLIRKTSLKGAKA